MRLTLFLGLAAISAVSGLFANPAAAFDAKEREEIGGIVREYLLTHPEVMVEVQQELEKRQQAEAARKSKAALAEQRELIERSKHQATVGNPDGDVTLVEFFDYNCGYCKRALGDMNALIKEDPKLRVVLKEFPVLGQGSLEAAQVAMAVIQSAPEKYLAFHTALLGARGAADRARALAAAKEVGIDAEVLEKALATPEIRTGLEETYGLANALGLTGTPAYIIGDEVVPGAIGVDQLKQRIAAVRKCGKAAC